jgi:hypothetical protein
MTAMPEIGMRTLLGSFGAIERWNSGVRDGQLEWTNFASERWTEHDMWQGRREADCSLKEWESGRPKNGRLAMDNSRSRCSSLWQNEKEPIGTGIKELREIVRNGQIELGPGEVNIDTDVDNNHMHAQLEALIHKEHKIPEAQLIEIRCWTKSPEHRVPICCSCSRSL